MQRLIRISLVVVAVVLGLGGAGCTTRHRVTKEAVPCTSTCTSTKAVCLASCGTSTGQAQVVEDVREHLCDKRCVEDYERCMLACPGVGG